MNIPLLESEHNIDYESSYLNRGARGGEDWKLRSLTGEGGYIFHNYTRYPNGTEEGDEYIDFWENSLTEAALHLHDGVMRANAQREDLEDINQPPKVIFITATRAVPYAFAIKQFWREAYPDEPAPAFKVIDSSDRRFGPSASDEIRHSADEKEVSKLQEVGSKYGFDNVAVFDEFANSGHTLKTTEALLKRAGFKDVNCIWGRFGDPYAWLLPDDELPIIRENSVQSDYKELREVVWNAGQASRALIKDMKMVGHYMAVEARKRGYIK